MEIEAQGRSVFASITSFGSGCVREADTEVQIEGLNVLIAPYVFTPPPGGVCTRDIRPIEHQVVVPIETAGRVRITIHGITTETNPNGEPISFVRNVTVR